MYKIMLADDEGIVIDSLKFIIDKNFGKDCMVEYAKTGRSVIELAESFRPDIVIMDIHMPGINGIEAMKEIRKFDKRTHFIVMTAYDKFDYAKEAINLGVLEYLNKPVDKKDIISVLKRSMEIITENRKKRSQELLIKEKMEHVTPIIENGFLYSIIFQEDYTEDILKYKELLGMEEGFGYFCVIECGDQTDGKRLSNAVGAGIKVQSCYHDIYATIKECIQGVVGNIMGNRIMVFIPMSEELTDYSTRVSRMESCKDLIHKLKERIDLEFRIGIGSVKKLEQIGESYQEAIHSLRIMDDDVVHIQDIQLGCMYDDNYPIKIEQRLFEMIRKGEVGQTRKEAEDFFEWMEMSYPDALLNIKLKILEFVLYSDYLVYKKEMAYHFTDRSEYLPTVMGFTEFSEMNQWFVDKLTAAARNMKRNSIQEQSQGTIAKAKAYIKKNYSKNISLDDVSREMNISPYYFSKVFKEETGENFHEYVTAIRLSRAKELLLSTDMSIKEIGVLVGYFDPNYFSRIFKKNEGITPTEYKESR